MQMDARCVACLVERQAKLTSGRPNDERDMAFMRRVLQAIPDAPEGVSASWCVPLFEQAAKECLGLSDLFSDVKRRANEWSMEALPAVREQVLQADDPLKMALKFSRAGNILDFAVLSEDTIREKFRSVLEKTPLDTLDEAVYARFCAQLAQARQALIIGDNAGEIVFDVPLVEQLRRQYPGLEIYYGVRGGPAQNDATQADALAAGMDRIARVIGSGCCIPATELSCCSGEFCSCVEESNLILAKGQANYESLCGCGRNVYYLFLCKCDRLAQILNKPQFTGIFAAERP